MSLPLTLPEELTIYTVASLKTTWLNGLDAIAASTPSHPETPDRCCVEAAMVNEVDGAGVQLLVSLQRSAVARDLEWMLLNPSERLKSALLTLGLSALLAAPGSPPEHAA